jgi:hypothetical protein
LNDVPPQTIVPRRDEILRARLRMTEGLTPHIPSAFSGV